MTPATRGTARTPALTSQLVVRLRPEEHIALVEHATAEDRPVASLVRRILREHLAQSERRSAAPAESENPQRPAGGLRNLSPTSRVKETQ